MSTTTVTTIVKPSSVVSTSTSTSTSSSSSFSSFSSSTKKPAAVVLPRFSKRFPRDFTWSQETEPHAIRRREILAKHPEIATLFGPEPLTCPIVLGILAVQIVMACLMQNQSVWVIFICAYAIGGTLNHSLQLAAHEISHNLCFSSVDSNRYMGIICNFATGVPSSVSFQKYHMDHHQFQGVDGMDTDIPTVLEVNVVTNTLLKICWVIAQPLFYALRPVLVKPKQAGLWEAVNFAAVLSFDLAIFHFFGLKSLAYLLAGTLLGMGLHPAAGHFIAEHYEFITGQETYSYYGVCNYLNFNVGYHNEHHDFPQVPWSRLAQVKAMAPEYYDNIPFYTSYVKVIWDYITDPEMGPFCRIKRHAGQRSKMVEKCQQRQKEVGYGFRIFAVLGFTVVLGSIAAASVMA